MWPPNSHPGFANGQYPPQMAQMDMSNVDPRRRHVHYPRIRSIESGKPHDAPFASSMVMWRAGPQLAFRIRLMANSPAHLEDRLLPRTCPQGDLLQSAHPNHLRSQQMDATQPVQMDVRNIDPSIGLQPRGNMGPMGNMNKMSPPKLGPGADGDRTACAWRDRQ